MKRSLSLFVFGAVMLLSQTGCSSQTDTTTEEATLPAETEQAQNTSNDNHFIGLTVEEAEAMAPQHSLTVRVVKKDGVSLPATMDYLPNRLNLEIENGKVVATSRG